MFKNITIENWRQFEKIQMEFHPRLTIITGANGAGKTTILNVLNQHFGWYVGFVSKPEFNDEKGSLQYMVDISKDPQSTNIGNDLDVGEISYTNAFNICRIKVPNSVSHI